MGKKIGYARVSSKTQIEGTSLEAQEEKLLSEGCGEVHKEQFTGTKTDRPIFNKVLESLQDGDTLVVTKLDRFARTTVEGITTVKALMKRGVKVHILNMGLIEDTPTGRLIFNIMSSFAEFERDMIVERTSEGRAIAKKNGTQFGRKKKNDDVMKHAIDLYKKGEMSVRAICSATGVAKATLCRRIAELKAKEEVAV